MPKDFTRTRRQPDKRTNVLFHGPSFVAGIVLGALGVLAGAYGPELLEQTPVTKASPAEPTKPKLTFEFPKLLKENKVVVDPTPYTPPGAVTNPTVVTTPEVVLGPGAQGIYPAGGIIQKRVRCRIRTCVTTAPGLARQHGAGDARRRNLVPRSRRPLRASRRRTGDTLQVAGTKPERDSAGKSGIGRRVLHGFIRRSFQVSQTIAMACVHPHYRASIFQQ